MSASYLRALFSPLYCTVVTNTIACVAFVTCNHIATRLHISIGVCASHWSCVTTLRPGSNTETPHFVLVAHLNAFVVPHRPHVCCTLLQSRITALRPGLSLHVGSCTVHVFRHRSRCLSMMNPMFLLHTRVVQILYSRGLDITCYLYTEKYQAIQ